MEAYYSPVELKAIGTGIAREVGSVDEYTQSLCQTTFAQLIELPALAKYRSELLERFAMEKAVAVCGEAANRLGASETPDSMNQVATVLTAKVLLLRELDRPHDALVACDELIGHFGGDDTPAVLEHVARGLVNKAGLLISLRRFDEALAVSDDVVHRCGAADTPELSHLVAEALNTKAGSLILLERFDAALAVCDDTLHRFGSDRRPSLIEPVARVLGFKAFAFNKLDRSDEARAAFDEAVQRLEEDDSSSALETMQIILLQKAELELNGLRYEAVITTADRLLAQRTESSENRWKAHLARGKACLAMNGPSACGPDIEAILAILPGLDVLPRDCLDALMRLSIDVGPKRMLELIQASPSTTLLGTTDYSVRRRPWAPAESRTGDRRSGSRHSCGSLCVESRTNRRRRAVKGFLDQAKEWQQPTEWECPSLEVLSYVRRSTGSSAGRSRREGRGSRRPGRHGPHCV